MVNLSETSVQTIIQNPLTYLEMQTLYLNLNTEVFSFVSLKFANTCDLFCISIQLDLESHKQNDLKSYVFLF